MSDDKSIPPAYVVMPDGSTAAIRWPGDFKSAQIQPNGYPQPGPGGNTVGLILPMTALGPVLGNTQPPLEGSNESLHNMLDVLGYLPVPVVPSVASGLDAGLYAAEGDAVNAAMSALSIVPGEKILTGVGKLAGKGIKAVRGSGKAAEDAAKAAKAAEDAKKAQQAAQAAREAEEAKRAAAARKAEEEAKGGAKKAEGEGGGYVAARKMKHKTVKCFKKNKEGKPNEYDRQLKDQEKGLNDMTVQEYLDGRQRYQEIGRKGTGAAQAKARSAHQKELTQKYENTLNRQGIVGEAAQQQAQAMAEKEMKTLAALHNPDMIAGGKDVITGMGDSGVNSSIGSQWKSRIGELDEAARQVPASERATTRMSVTLSRC